MLSIAHAGLRVDLLDPTAEAYHLGERFCAGGYIWQVHDERAGPLLSGPEGPEPRPDPFNGHGLPESFRDRSRRGEKWLWQGDEALAPGAGTLRRTPDGVTLVEPCVWHLDVQPTHAEFRTRHAAAGFACEVERTVALTGRTLRSRSRITNHGDHTMRFEWFAHPFFALDAAGAMRVRLPATASLPPDTGFELDHGTLQPSRRYIGKDDGAFALLEGVTGEPLQVTVSHPRLPEGIVFRTDFPLSECPIWVNGFTFSIEPYQVLTIAPGEAMTWELTYTFGHSSATA